VVVPPMTLTAKSAGFPVMFARVPGLALTKYSPFCGVGPDSIFETVASIRWYPPAVIVMQLPVPLAV
jgi:hypothetical protein